MEPFVGGGSMFLHLLQAERFDRYHINDKNSDLIGLWNAIKAEPQALSDKYAELWSVINGMSDIEQRQAEFRRIRGLFNETRDPYLFLFLTRTSYNGLVRYNSKGEFNTSYHFTRKGVDPKELKKNLTYWSGLMNTSDVTITNQNYDEIQYPDECFVFLDPPYQGSDGLMYDGKFSQEQFLTFLRDLRCDNMVTLSTKIDGYQHLELKSNGSFKRMHELEDISSTEVLNYKI